jgi:hypothetical protein
MNQTFVLVLIILFYSGFSVTVTQQDSYGQIDMVGTWEISGQTTGLPVNGRATFLEDGTYTMMIEIQGRSVEDEGMYNLNMEAGTLELRSSSAVITTYNISESGDSIQATNTDNREFYKFTPSA